MTYFKLRERKEKHHALHHMFALYVYSVIVCVPLVIDKNCVHLHLTKFEFNLRRDKSIHTIHTIKMNQEDLMWKNMWETIQADKMMPPSLREIK